MLNVRLLSAILSLVVILMGATFFIHAAALHKDDYLYSQIITIEGKVEILNPPEGGRTVANHEYIIFQRVDCKKCLVAARSDIDGKYLVFVGRGRYRVIIRDIGSREGDPSFDVLAPDQPRFVDAGNDAQFNIKIVRPH